MVVGGDIDSLGAMRALVGGLGWIEGGPHQPEDAARPPRWVVEEPQECR